MFKSTLGSLIFLLCFYLAKSFNYCNQNLCGEGQKHIACNNSGKFAATCGDFVELLPIKENLRLLIMNTINGFRNRVASGHLKGYNSAKHMVKLRWDKELSKLAEYHAMQCTSKTDECRNTKKFQHVGQLIGTYAFPDNFYFPIELILKETLNAWFHQYKNANKDMMQEYKISLKGQPHGHFAQMIMDINTHIGCSILRQNLNKTIYQYLTCNFGRTLLSSLLVYVSGKTASDCKTGTDRIFTSLCTERELVNINAY